ncbi:adenylate cyclase-like protein [Leptomonas pyrrhocoris]|uniref:Adenylate cyclase-like protein n=1 Tax=Leptomonas pyrrhocoris TaxID=157538 RepID=A0A0M9FPU1_LEPPY|nr:adenylate cyclase-like protein [Leptomonas pyrrhocoris]KPA73610.1 adenylate cyclase-like protein [Leptomonas pyrrhocoris]|eukprot:XP_015652049.1 adenylate cyclase-like protein [Leptomonas pyrrhocoris]
MEALLRIMQHVVHADSAPAAITYSDQLSIQSLFTEYGAEFNADVMKKLEEPFLDACESYMASTGMWNVVVRAVLQELWSVYITGYWTAQPASGEHERHGGSAPDGKTPFCLMFTDIEASTRLWDSDPKVMGAAVRLHHKLVRGLIEDFGGYEVKTVGDSFIIAANTVTQALHIALGIQLELMAEPSAPDFRMVDSPQGAGDPACWREDALRVRVGVHYCADASAVYDSVHRRFDYYGPSVNCAARVEAAACGGQVLLSHEAYAQLQTEEDFDQVPVNSLFAEHLGQLVRAQEARGVAVTDPQLAACCRVGGAGHEVQNRSAVVARRRFLAARQQLQQQHNGSADAHQLQRGSHDAPVADTRDGQGPARVEGHFGADAARLAAAAGADGAFVSAHSTRPHRTLDGVLRRQCRLACAGLITGGRGGGDGVGDVGNGIDGPQASVGPAPAKRRHPYAPINKYSYIHSLPVVWSIRVRFHDLTFFLILSPSSSCFCLCHVLKKEHLCMQSAWKCGSFRIITTIML